MVAPPPIRDSRIIVFWHAFCRALAHRHLPETPSTDVESGGIWDHQLYPLAHPRGRYFDAGPQDSRPATSGRLELNLESQIQSRSAAPRAMTRQFPEIVSSTASRVNSLAFPMPDFRRGIRTRKSPMKVAKQSPQIEIPGAPQGEIFPNGSHCDSPWILWARHFR